MENARTTTTLAQNATFGGHNGAIEQCIHVNRVINNDTLLPTSYTLCKNLPYTQADTHREPHMYLIDEGLSIIS